MTSNVLNGWPKHLLLAFSPAIQLTQGPTKSPMYIYTLFALLMFSLLRMTFPHPPPFFFFFYIESSHLYLKATSMQSVKVPTIQYSLKVNFIGTFFFFLILITYLPYLSKSVYTCVRVNFFFLWCCELPKNEPIYYLSSHHWKLESFFDVYLACSKCVLNCSK